MKLTSLNPKQKTLVLRLVRSAAATGVAALIGFILSPHAAALVGDQTAVVLAGVLVPALHLAEKWLRYGSDPGETPEPKSN